MDKNIKNLLQMETIENNLAYGELKINTDKERIYIDTKSRKVYQSLLGYDFNGAESWETEEYSFEEWSIE